MHKNEFIRQLARETGLPQKEVGEIVKRSMSLIARVLRDGDKVVLTGFGTFEVRTRRERRGVNPKTKEKIIIPATQTPGFTASNTLKQAVLGQLPVERVAAAFDSPDEADDSETDTSDAAITDADVEEAPPPPKKRSARRGRPRNSNIYQRNDSPKP